MADVDAKQGIMVTSTKSDASYVQSDIFGMSRQDGLLSGKNLFDFVTWANGLTALGATISNVTTSSFTMTSTSADSYTLTYNNTAKWGKVVTPSTSYTVSFVRTNATAGNVIFLYKFSKH